MTRVIVHTTLNEHTFSLLEREAIPLLIYFFKNARGAESSWIKTLAGGQDSLTFHRPESDAYSFRIWLNNPVWNSVDNSQLAEFLELTAERLDTDKNLLQQFITELISPPGYQSDSLRPRGDEEGRLFPMFNLAVELQ
jgi:hypothetical protein